MLNVTCAKCGRRFTPTAEEVHSYLAASQDQKHALVPCPHCGKGNKVDTQRLQQSVRFGAPDRGPATPAGSEGG